jgi:two-component sensor histidine kinase
LRYDGNVFYETIQSIAYNVAFYTFEDPDDYSIYAGTNKGLYQLINGQQKHWDVQPGNGKSRSITSLVKDRSGRIWIAGFNGISLLEQNEIKHLPSPEMPFPHGGNALLRDSLDNIWIGNPHGLFLYNNDTFVSINHPKLDKLVLSLAMVGDSALLIGTISDLLMLDVKTYYQSGEVSIMTIGPDKGYHAIEPGQNGFYKDTKGYYWLTNSDRVIRIDPSQLHANTIPPEVYIRSVSLMDERMQWNPLESHQMQKPEFSYAKDEKNIRFDITAVSLRDPLGVTYSHFLEGYDKGWSSPDNESAAIYTNLQPGEYTLHFKAANTDGVWSEEDAFSFVIKPAFYQTIWFKVSGVLMAAAFLFFGGVVLTNQRRKKQMEIQENEKKIAEFQLLSIKNQIDPHFTYNAINSIAAAVAKEDKELAYRFFVKLSRLMRSILQSSDKLTRTLEEELAFVQDYLEIQKFRHKDRFDFVIEISPEVDLSRGVPKMCIQTFVENALKHGLLHSEKNGLLTITIKDFPDRHILEIQDNGIGREKAKSYSENSAGKGLQILKGYFDYFNRYNQQSIYWETTDLWQDDGTSGGTSVRIILPKDFIFNL